MFALQSVLQASVEYIFPPMCVHCRCEGTWLCAAGRAELAAVEALVDPLSIDGVDRVWCAGSYDVQLLANIITGIKYHGWTAYQELLPDMFRSFSPNEFRSQRPWVIPVPLHGRRRRWRGFNQAELIAHALAITTGLQLHPCLRRTRYTTAQATLSAAARMTNIQAAFRLCPGVETLPLCGILVDDVITTGSTIHECASVLREAGMKEITAVALAKG